MNSVDHGFGRSQYTYRKGFHQLKLSNVSSIVLSSAQAIEFPFSQTFKSLNKLTSSRTWISRSHHLQLAFHVIVDDVTIPGYDGAELVEQLATILCHAEVKPIDIASM